MDWIENGIKINLEIRLKYIMKLKNIIYISIKKLNS